MSCIPQFGIGSNSCVSNQSVKSREHGNKYRYLCTKLAGNLSDL